MFEALAALVLGMLDEVLEGIFINGLKLEIRAELRLLSLKGLGQLINESSPTYRGVQLGAKNGPRKLSPKEKGGGGG